MSTSLESNELHRQLLAALESRAESLVRVLLVEDISKAADVLSRRLLTTA